MARSRSLASGDTAFKVGDVVWTSRSAAPPLWLTCDGSAVSRTTYALLFAAIGTTFGAGDGSTTFNLPDARGRTSIGVGTGPSLTARALGASGGAETHQLDSTQIPAHTHRVYGTTGGGSASTSSLANSINRGFAGSNDNTGAGYITNAPTGGVQLVENTGGGTAHNNMQPFLALNAFIYAGA